MVDWAHWLCTHEYEYFNCRFDCLRCPCYLPEDPPPLCTATRKSANNMYRRRPIHSPISILRHLLSILPSDAHSSLPNSPCQVKHSLHPKPLFPILPSFHLMSKVHSLMAPPRPHIRQPLRMTVMAAFMLTIITPMINIHTHHAMSTITTLPNHSLPRRTTTRPKLR